MSLDVSHVQDMREICGFQHQLVNPEIQPYTTTHVTLASNYRAVFCGKRNLPDSAEFPRIHGMLQNSAPASDKATNTAYFGWVQAEN